MSDAPRHIDLTAEALIKPYLTEGETLRWAGRPARFPVPKGSLYIVLASLLFLFLHAVNISSRIPPIFAIVTLLLFVALYSFILVCQVYGITNQRVIISNRIFLGQTYSVSFTPHMWKDRIVHKRYEKTGIGTIWIHDRPNSLWNLTYIRPIFVPSNSALYEVGLYKGTLTQALFNINDIAYVESLLPRWHDLD